MTRPADRQEADACDTADDTEMAPPVVFDEPTNLPGHARVAFSPLQFYALSRVQRLDVDPSPEGLWLTEEAAPKITKKGFAFFSRTFTHDHIQAFITGLPNTPRRDLLIRYNKAALARGILQEVILCERLAGGQVVERLRCRTRERVMAERDVQAAIREKERFLAVLRAKSTRAQEERLTLLHGAAAVERFLDEQTERAQRQRRQRSEPIAAKPIRAHSRADAAARDAAVKVHAIADHLAGGVSVDAYDDTADASGAQPAPADLSPPRPAGRPESEPTPPRPSGARQATGGSKGSSTLARGRRDPGGVAPPAAQAPPPTVPQASTTSTAGPAGEGSAAPLDATASVAPVPSLLEALGGRTGILPPDDE